MGIGAALSAFSPYVMQAGNLFAAGITEKDKQRREAPKKKMELDILGQKKVINADKIETGRYEQDQKVGSDERERRAREELKKNVLDMLSDDETVKKQAHDNLMTLMTTEYADTNVAKSFVGNKATAEGIVNPEKERGWKDANREDVQSHETEQNRLDSEAAERRARISAENKEKAAASKPNMDFDSKLRKDSVLAINDKVVRAATDLRKMLESNNPISHEVIGTKMAKLSGEVGNLALQEQLQYKGSQALLEQLKAKVVKAGKGTMSQENRKFALDLVDMYESTARSSNNTRIEAIMTGHSAVYDIEEDSLYPIARAYGYAPNLEEYTGLGGASGGGDAEGWADVGGGIKIREKK